MAPEPEPGPRDDALECQAPDYGHPAGEPVPAGLVYADGILRPDPTISPDLVRERDPQWTERLARDPRLPAIVADLLSLPEVRDALVAIWDPATDPDTRSAAQAFLWRALLAGSELLDAPGFTITARSAFLGREVVRELFAHYGATEPSPDFLEDLFGPLEPVLLQAVPPWAPTGQPLTISPGDIVLKFRAASRPERDRYEILVTEIQRSFGHTPAAGAKDRGGRRSIADDPVKAEQAKATAKLARMGLTGSQIAAVLGWVQPGDTGREKKYAKRVDDYVAAGIELIPPGSPEWEATRRLPALGSPIRRSVRAWMDLKGPRQG
ncbi:MAG: hypothetical protein M3Q71_14550 [Chloroflexota bacterium]|nr:hypothetical protein [Chloroflexota bacterium]